MIQIYNINTLYLFRLSKANTYIFDMTKIFQDYKYPDVL